MASTKKHKTGALYNGHRDFKKHSVCVWVSVQAAGYEEKSHFVFSLFIDSRRAIRNANLYAYNSSH